MSTACNWLSLFLCLRGTSNNKKAIHQIHPNQRSFDAVVVWKGKGLQKSTGGVAYDYILKPAADSAPKISSPPKDKPLTHDEIFEKLQKAEARRQSLEAQKLEFVAKEKQRMQEALMKSQKEEEEKAKAAQAKLRRSMEITKENRELQIMSLQEKLREHLAKVQEVCKNSESMSKELEERLIQKYEAYEENRNNQLQSVVKRLQDHAKHIEEVCKASETMSKTSEEKIIQKMENALKNREEHFKALQERLKDHERKIEEVRKNKMTMSNCSMEGSVSC